MNRVHIFVHQPMRIIHRHATLLAAISIYSILCVALAFGIDGSITSINSDFGFYNNAVVTALEGWVSPLAQNLYEQSPYVDPLYRQGWLATPFYSYLFLAPIWLLGSQLIFGLLGWGIGILTLIGFYCLIRAKLEQLPWSYEFALMCILPLNFNFLVDSVGVSTMSVAAMFVILAFVVKHRFLRMLLFSCAAMTRSNYLIALACAFVVLVMLRPKGWRELLVDFTPSVIVTMIFYVSFYSTYPGSGLNYIFSTVYQGLDYAQPMGVELVRSRLGIESEESLFSSQMSIQDFFHMLTFAQTWSYIFNVWALKVSVTLGLIHEKLFESDYEFWLAKAWRTSYFVAISLPGIYAAVIVFISRHVNLRERSIYLWIFLYLGLNSLLIGDPRYLMGSCFFLALGLVRLLSLLQLSFRSS